MRFGQYESYTCGIVPYDVENDKNIACMYINCRAVQLSLIGEYFAVMPSTARCRASTMHHVHRFNRHSTNDAFTEVTTVLLRIKNFVNYIQL